MNKVILFIQRVRLSHLLKGLYISLENKLQKNHYISLGHRCHINQAIIKLGYKKVAYPFDNVISNWEGIIDCFANDFKNFFPKDCNKITNTIDSIGTGPRNENDCRILFKGKFFCFTHHDLRNKKVVDKFRERIERLDTFLSNVKDPVIFLRTICFNDEYKLYDLYKDIIKEKYPKLNFKVVFIATMPSNKTFKIYRRNDYVLAEDSHIQLDENDGIVKNRFKGLVEFMDSYDIFENFNKLEEVDNDYVHPEQVGKNASVPADMSGNTYPFDESN